MLSFGLFNLYDLKQFGDILMGVFEQGKGIDCLVPLTNNRAFISAEQQANWLAVRMSFVCVVGPS